MTQGHMRIVVHGQQAFGKAVLEALVDRGEEVIAVYVAADREGRPPDPLKQAALERGLAVLQPTSFHGENVCTEFAALQPDLCVMAYVTLFVPESFLNVPTHGSIQYHPSLLPKHRGPSSINWALIQGDTRTGLTIFWPDKGLDTGPILLQQEVEIGADDTLGSVYFGKLFPLGIEALVEAVDLVRSGEALKIAQDDAQASYESWCRAENVEIDWGKPVDEVYNLIRGANPQPGAWTLHDGSKLQIYDARKLGGAVSGAPGEVTRVTAEGFAAAAAGGEILALWVRPQGGEKMSAAAFCAAAGLAPGARLG